MHNDVVVSDGCQLAESTVQTGQLIFLLGLKTSPKDLHIRVPSM